LGVATGSLLLGAWRVLEDSILLEVLLDNIMGEGSSCELTPELMRAISSASSEGGRSRCWWM